MNRHSGMGNKTRLMAEKNMLKVSLSKISIDYKEEKSGRSGKDTGRITVRKKP